MLKSRKSNKSRQSNLSQLEHPGPELMTLDSKKCSRTSQYRSLYRQSSINDQIIFQRKENYLNAHFHRRKETLKEITKANHKIYFRINSQKSQYDQKKCVPYQRPSSRTSSKCSRVSSQSSKSRSSSGSRLSVKEREKQARMKEAKSQMAINSQSINQMKE